MDYNIFFKSIEDHYFNRDYHSVIKLWKKYKYDFELDYTKEYDDKILEIIKASYDELGYKKESLKLLDKQIRLLPRLQIPAYEKEKKLQYYLNNIMSILLEENKLIKYYRLKRQYLDIWKNKEYEQQLSDIENLFYLKFIKINKYFTYFLILLVLIHFITGVLDVQINNTVNLYYDILTGVTAVWVLFFIVFRKKIHIWFNSIFRYLFSAKSNYDLIYLKK